MAWLDELRSPVAAALFALMLLAGGGMVGVIMAGNTGALPGPVADLWSFRLFVLACGFALTYGVVKAVQVCRQRGGGFDVLWKDDDDERA